MSFSEDIKRIRRETGKAKPNLKTMKLIDEYCKKNSIDFDISQEI